MSTLEKAFLKAMSSESAVEKTEKNEDEYNLSRLSISKNIPHAKETHEITTSRQGISQIAEVEKFSISTLIEKRLIYSIMKDKKLLERYRTIRTKLLSDTKKENFVTIVTSVIPYENNALIAANLAATFSFDEAKTSMLVEANIGNPKLNQLFDMTDKKGLIDYLESDSRDSSEVLQKTGVPRLGFVPSGLHRENSSEYFSSSKMKEFIKELVDRYPDRFPIINAPCVIESADTRILIEHCEKVVLVIPYGKCSDEQVMQAALSIGEEKLAGVILDGF